MGILKTSTDFMQWMNLNGCCYMSSWNIVGSLNSLSIECLQKLWDFKKFEANLFNLNHSHGISKAFEILYCWTDDAHINLFKAQHVN